MPLLKNEGIVRRPEEGDDPAPLVSIERAFYHKL
jgi:hypothetical protein